MDDYDTRREETLLKRLLVVLRDRGILTDGCLIQLAYPTDEQIEAVEWRDVL